MLVLLQRMEREGVAPNTVLLTTAINSLARVGGKYTDYAARILKVASGVLLFESTIVRF